MNPNDARELVRDRYAKVALETGSSCCSPAPTPLVSPDALPVLSSGCCGSKVTVEELAKTAGYTAEELLTAPDGANLGLGCGNPQAIADMKPGEVILDLGSGAGFDAFLAARKVGETGRVIGVDMTPEMLARARQNAAIGKYTNVEFRLGEIEHLPVADQSVDVIISNCVINLSPEKPSVFREAFRVLKPGGRLAISDMVATMPIPEALRQDPTLYTGCVAGAVTQDELHQMLETAGFVQVQITPKESRRLVQMWGPGTKLDEIVFSAYIQAVRP